MKRILVIAALAIASSRAGAQAAATPAAVKHAPTCARAVKMYDDIKQVPTPHDTVQVPPADGPVRVTNEAEAEAAELALRARAASVGATGVLVTDVEQNDGSGMVMMRRSVTGIYVRADSAAAQKVCSGK